MINALRKLEKIKLHLITGEEKIIPNTAQYFICTVEAMPKDKVVDFVAVDEIQMCGDRERGHIFTDRLLNFKRRSINNVSWFTDNEKYDFKNNS